MSWRLRSPWRADNRWETGTAGGSEMMAGLTLWLDWCESTAPQTQKETNTAAALASSIEFWQLSHRTCYINEKLNSSLRSSSVFIIIPETEKRQLQFSIRFRNYCWVDSTQWCNFLPNKARTPLCSAPYLMFHVAYYKLNNLSESVSRWIEFRFICQATRDYIGALTALSQRLRMKNLREQVLKWPHSLKQF